MSDRCLVPDCIRVGKRRDLCNTHYAAAVNCVRMCDTTWEILELTGKVGAPKSPGRPAGKALYQKKGAVKSYFLTLTKRQQAKVMAHMAAKNSTIPPVPADAPVIGGEVELAIDALPSHNPVTAALVLA